MALAALLLALVLACAAGNALASVRASGHADPGLNPAQARQQALERALLEAVLAEAKGMLGARAPEARLAALRQHLAPNAIGYIQTYQEIAARPEQQAEVPAEQKQPEAKGSDAKTAEPKPAEAKGQEPNPGEVEISAEVNRLALRNTLVRLGFFSPAQVYELKPGSGLAEKDLRALEPLAVLLGVSRASQAPLQITVERLPGYYKAVLREGQQALAVDSSDLAALWLNLWGRRYTDLLRQSGPGKVELSIAGFASVDAAQDFARLLASWDEAVQEAALAALDLDASGVSARFTCRVVSQPALDKRLAQALAARKLRLAGAPPDSPAGSAKQ